MITRFFCWLGFHAWTTNRWGQPYHYCPHCGIRYDQRRGVSDEQKAAS